MSMVWLLSERLESTSLKLEAASAQLAGITRGLEALARNAANAAVRAAVVADAREGMVTAPPTADGNLAPVMIDAFRGVDKIGAMP